MTTLDPNELAVVTGGMGIVRELITSAVGGWQLANQMYGRPEHGAPWAEKWRAMKAIKGYLDGRQP